MAPRSCLVAWTALIALMLAPTHAFAAQGTTVIIGPDGDRVSPDGGSITTFALQSTASATFQMRPSVLTTTRSPYGTGEQSLRLRLGCLLLPSRIIVPNCRLTIDWTVEPGSGGHLHTAGRPPGRVETENGVIGGSVGPGAVSITAPTITDSTGRDGLLTITYVAPEAAGLTRFTFSGVAVIAGEVVSFPATRFSIGVGLDGMVQMPPKSERFGTGVLTAGHGANNGYVLPAVQTAMEDAWDDFKAILESRSPAPVDPPRLFISAAGLPRGGLFDLANNWKPGEPGHVGHRFGLDVDIVPMANMTDKQSRVIAKTLKRNAFIFPVDDEAPRTESTDHWHARFIGVEE